MSSTALFVISLVVALASAAVSIVAAVKAKNAVVAVGEEDSLTLGDINVTQQSEGLVVPIVYGHGCLCGNTIWWYAEKFGTVPNEQYRVCLWQTICMGRIYLLSLYIDEKPVPLWIGSYWESRLQFSRGEYSGDAEQYGVPADYRQYFPNDGDYATVLSGVSHAFIKFFELPIGVSNIYTFKFRVLRLLTYIHTNAGGITLNPLPHPDRANGSNPASIIYDLLVNDQYGLGIDPSNINLTSFINASNYFHEKFYYLSFVINQSMSVKDIIAKIQDWVECFLIKNADDDYELIYFQDSDADTPIATITDDDMVEFSLHRKSWNDTFNSFTANWRPYLTPTSGYGLMEVKTSTLKNEANISMTGSVRNKVIDLTAFSWRQSVDTRLNQIMKKESYPFATATLTTNLKYSFLRRGNVITLNSDEYNFIGPFRVIDITINEIDKTQIDFELIQLRELVADDITDPASRAEGIYTEAILIPCAFTLTFPPNSNISEPCPRAFIIDADSKVAWSAGQTLKGMLTYGIDYTIQDHVRVVLDPDIFEAEIMMNAYGLLSVDVYEPGCPSPPTES